MEAEIVIKYPLSTEKSLRLMESENKLVFVVHNKATKADIKKAIETLLNAKVAKVTTHNTMDGTKRAYVKFTQETQAIDIATSLGLM
jgi:large subunit ribosomal protein L23